MSGGTAVYALTPRGAALARRLARSLGAELFLPERFAERGERGFASLTEQVGENFQAYAAHVFVAACGIVVRSIAPLLRGKDVDPAVIVLDQEGRHAVSLLSGHLGGANDLAREVALLAGGEAVITTATDCAGLPSLDLLARDSGLAIGDLGAVKAVNAALLEGRTVQLFDPQGLLAVPGEHAGLFEWLAAPHLIDPRGPCVVVDWRADRAGPGCLALHPRVVAAGVGCRRGTPADEVLAALEGACAARGVALASVGVLASIAAKRDEPGLIQAARQLGARMMFFEAEELAGVDVPNPSPMPLKHVGVESVCEAAALLAAGTTRLLAQKIKTPTVTVALALTP